MAEVAQYRALRRGQITAGVVVERGQVFAFEGVPGLWMEPVNGTAEKAKAARDKDLDAELNDEDASRRAPVLPAAEGPSRIKTHPDLPNPEGSSGEDEGDDVPFAALKRREREASAAQSDATRSARSGRGAKPGRGKKAKRRAAKPADTRPPRPQSDPAATADDAGTT